VAEDSRPAEDAALRSVEKNVRQITWMMKAGFAVGLVFAALAVYFTLTGRR
jgi:hypothetical protein